MENKKLDAFRKTRPTTKTRKSKVSLITSVANGPDTVNTDGFPAYSDTSLQQSAARVVLCGLVKDQYYTPKEIQAGEAVQILKATAKADPLYLLKLAVLARKNNLKFMVKMIVAALSPYDTFTTQHEQVIVGLLKSFHPGQLLEYVELQKSKVFGRGLGSRQQRWVAKAIEAWDERNTVYYTLKYRRDFNVLLRLVHPRPAPFRDYVLDVKEGKKAGSLHARQSALESIKGSKQVDKIAETMIEFDIPWDVVKGFAPSTDRMWFAYMQQSGTSAVLLNTRNYINHGVFKLEGGFDEFQRLLNSERLQKARLLPLDVAKTFAAVRGLDSAVEKQLTDVFADSFLVPIEGLSDKRVAISIDLSGSMNGDTLLTAGTVAASFINHVKSAWITGFDTGLHEEGSTHFPQLTGVKPKTMVKRLFDLHIVGGTDTSVAVTKALKDGEVYDYFVILTDEQQNAGSPLIEVFEKYRKKINKDAILFIVNVTTYPWHAAREGANVILFNTVTPMLFKSMSYIGQDLISLVNEVSLTAPAATPAEPEVALETEAE